MNFNPQSFRPQFSTSALLSLTAVAALGMVLLPLACQLYLEIVCLSAFLLCIVSSFTDQLSQCKRSIGRTMLAASLVIAAIGVVVHVLQGRVFAFPALALAVAIALAAYPKSVALGRWRLALSTLGLVAYASVMAWQFYQTHCQRYFINRCVASRIMSATIEKEGLVDYRLRSYTRSWRAPVLEIHTLFDALDREAFYLPITKCRLIFGCDKIESLSFNDAMTPADWKNLKSQSRVQYLDFTHVSISPADWEAMPRLDSLYQLAFFGCDLPDRLLEHCAGAKELSILQLVDCNTENLDGLAGLKALSTLSLHKTKLSRSDLDRIAALPLLRVLDLQDTGLRNEDYVQLAKCLTTTAPSRRGQFRCAVTYQPGIEEGLSALVRAGVIADLIIVGSAPGAELAQLKAIDNKVDVSTVEPEAAERTMRTAN